MKKLTWVILLSGFIVSGQLFSKSLCENSCDRFIACTEEIHKRKVKPEEEEKARIGCKKSCKKHLKEIKKCYENSNSSCMDYAKCIADASPK